jgi:NAD(P)-dependent dehydrogenase (short-subunit alcohol dehydrogenase family)
VNEKIVVVTGSTRGIGYGLVNEFLERGCAVVVSGRTHASVKAAVETLAAKYGADRVFGHPCDVARIDQVQALWDAAKDRFGRVDIWINNAGISHSVARLWDQSPQQIKAVVDTNLVGSIYGSHVALRGMLDQGGGSLYNMEGLGSDGRKIRGMTIYSTTKYAIRYLTESLTAEVEGSAVLVGSLSPGMVLTDLVVGEGRERSAEGSEQFRRIFNILGDRVETVTPWLADKVLANRKTGARISWLTTPKIFFRFATAPFRRRDLFAEESKSTPDR